jgi:transcriptional regulator with XRE-family HTH domain
VQDTADGREPKIARLQHNLSAIRKIAGWTAEQLGDKIGVSKQTISNLENIKSPMNLTQYIAIRAVIDYEIASSPENEVLPQVVAILLDSDNDEYEKVKEPVKIVAASAAGGIATGTLAGVLAALVPLTKLAIPVGVACASWLKDIQKNS